MKSLRLRVTLPALGVCAAVGLITALGATGSPASVKAGATLKATTITVTEGKPTELGFKLSKFSNIAKGSVSFKVTNLGLGFHTFKICTSTATSSAKNACVGKVTKLLKHGQSQTLTVTLSKTGKYEFLCDVTGHAAGGMKGLIGVGVVATGYVAPKAGSTPPPPPPPPPGPVNGGPPVAPAGNGCDPGKTIVTQGGNDADGDENGDIDDGDGCV